MYVQNEIAAAAAPVFHIDPPRIDPVERRAEVDHVIAIATAAIPKAQLKKLGRLSFATARDDDDYSYFGQIRSEPVGTSGLEFRFPMPARETGRRDVAATAAELVEGATAFATAAGKLKALSTWALGPCSEILQIATGGIAEMRLVAVGVTPGRSDASVKVTVDVEMLGDDLRNGVERLCEAMSDDALDRLEERLKELAAKHVERRKKLAQAKVAGTTGWIDGSALRILDIAGLSRATALDLLRLDRQVDFSFGGDRGYDLTGGVYWDDGVVRGFVENRDRENTFRLDAKVFTLEANRMPATIIEGLVGRHLSEVIEIAYIPGNALIVEVEESGDWLYLHLELDTTPIEDAVPTAPAAHSRG